MIGAITDIIQSSAILVWAVLMIFLSRRVGRLDNRINGLDAQRIIYRSTPEFQDPQPVCGCGHHQCFHDETGCSKIEFNAYNVFNEIKREPLPCGCKRYTGPEPLPTVIP